jgi:ATP-binding cassette subfamily A (ABC1) protein 3
VYIVDCRNGDFVSYPASIYAYGGPILYLCIQICIFFWFLNWLEGRHSLHLYTRKKPRAEDEEEEVRHVVSQEIQGEKARVQTSESDLLRVLQVSKSFGSNKAVDDVSFGISGGEILALLGPNGAGKSTIINMIRGELRADDGRILLQGIDMEKQTRLGQKNIGCTLPIPF